MSRHIIYGDDQNPWRPLLSTVTFPATSDTSVDVVPRLSQSPPLPDTMLISSQ